MKKKNSEGFKNEGSSQSEKTGRGMSLVALYQFKENIDRKGQLIIDPKNDLKGY